MAMTPDEIRDLLSPRRLECQDCGLVVLGDKFIQEHTKKHDKERQLIEMMEKAKSQQAKEQVKTLRDLLEANLK